MKRKSVIIRTSYRKFAESLLDPNIQFEGNGFRVAPHVLFDVETQIFYLQLTLMYLVGVHADTRNADYDKVTLLVHGKTIQDYISHLKNNRFVLDSCLIKEIEKNEPEEIEFMFYVIDWSL